MAMDSSDTSTLASLPKLDLQKFFEKEEGDAHSLCVAYANSGDRCVFATIGRHCRYRLQDLSPVSKVLSDARAALTVISKKIGEEKCDAFRRRLFLS